MEQRFIPPQHNQRVPVAPYPYHHYMAVQLRFSDIDVFGHVNNSVYFSLFDTAKIDYFNAVAAGKLDIHDIGIVVANVNCSFFIPTLITDHIEVYTTVESVHNRSFVLDQRIVDRRTNQVHALARTIMAGFDVKSGHSADLPAHWVEALEAFEQRPLHQPE